MTKDERLNIAISLLDTALADDPGYDGMIRLELRDYQRILQAKRVLKGESLLNLKRYEKRYDDMQL